MKFSELRERAIFYRKKGYSYGMISKKLGLAKSTLSQWLREVPYKPNKEVLRRIKFARIKSGLRQHEKRIRSIIKIKKLAKEELGKINKRDLWLLGIGLYLGEGSRLYETVRITNSDPEIIKLAIKWFKEICGVKNENFSLAIHLYPDNNVEKALNFWSKITGIPKKQFEKIQIDKRENKTKKKKGKLSYGTAHLKIKARGKQEFGVNLHRRIMGWIESILEQIDAGVV